MIFKSSINTHVFFACFLVVCAVFGLSTNTHADSDTAFKEVEWDDLIPPEWRVDPELIELYQTEKIGDDDPRIIEARRRLEAPNQPANPALDGQRIKIPGYVLPLDFTDEKLTEFLLLPYHGACIHVPPPPTNQTVFVKTDKEGVSIRGMFSTVWISGVLKIETMESELAEAGYTLYAEKVEPYEISQPY